MAFKIRILLYKTFVAGYFFIMEFEDGRRRDLITGHPDLPIHIYGSYRTTKHIELGSFIFVLALFLFGQLGQKYQRR
jgi:hypothetical protein